jgi:3-hydroxybutyrate dehydrogenase
MFLQGKRALVTGSTSGIGLAIARGLAAEGAQLVINGFGDPDAIAALVSEVSATSGAPARFIEADLMRREGAEALMEAAGPVDILVNNAGMQHVAPVEDFPVEKWDAIIALNLSASFHTCRMAVPAMKAQGWGRIIFMGSAHSLTASPYKSAYVAAKHGLAGLAKTLALELAETGITANLISPGYVWTPLVENQIPDTMKARNMTEEQVIKNVLLERQPTKRFVQPAEVAALATFLCREEAGNITGANYNIDGGWVAQ